MSVPNLDAAVRLLRSSKAPAVFTGAGMSAESGIATFRDVGGLWERYPAEDFATPGGIARLALREPEVLASFLVDLLGPVAEAEPNAGHRAVAILEDHVDVTVITQNVDALHQAAGSTGVHEVHGSLFKIVDMRHQTVRTLTRPEMRKLVKALEKAMSKRFVLPRVAKAITPFLGLSPTQGLAHRPSIVLFGEALSEPDWTSAQSAAASCDLMITIGTSGTVYPAAHLPEMARARGVKVIGVGPEVGTADVWLEGTAAAVLPALVDGAFSTGPIT